MSAYQACWTAEDARKILVTEALEGDDAIFLATHSPITGFDVDGRDAVDVRGRDERAVLDALANPELPHAFCVVQGEPGSGKSHLIRWLSVNWPHPQDQKLLLRRADGSLEGALRQLKERLPPDLAPLFDNLGQRHRATPEGRANIFLSTLVDTLSPGHFDPKLGDEAWLVDWSPAEIVGHPAVRKAWKSPARILALTEGGGGERNSQSATFNLFDIEDLADACRGHIIDKGATWAAEKLAARLDKEADIIRDYREAGWNSADLAQEAGVQLKTSLQLIEVLDRRRNDAIQNVLGVSGAALKTLFRNVRKALQARGQRLILLLEDITSWEGLDNSLIDVLIFNADAKDDEQTDDVCPLISVVGVTPTYYDKLHPNVRQRITHEIRLGESKGGLQDVASLRDPVARRRFISRYLAAVRAGLPALKAWRTRFGVDPNTPPPNVCGTCPHRAPCAEVFGEDDGVGLFPFTPHAIERFFDALKENDNRQTWRTPRGVLQAVLNHNLSQPEALDEGRFPTPLIEPTAFREDRRSDRVLSNRLEQRIEGRVDSPEDQARMRRVLAYWGNPDQADTTEIDGDLAFAGAPRRLFEAFALPWIGGDAATASGPAPPVEVTPLVTLELEPEPAEPTAGATTPTPQRGALRYTPPTRTSVAPPKPKGPKRTDLERFRDELRGWRKGETIQSAGDWNAMLFEMLRQLDPRRFGTPPALYARLLSKDMVKLKSTTQGGRDYFVLGPEPWVVDGFEAYLALKLGGVASTADTAFHRENLAVMMRRLEDLAAGYMARRIPRMPDGRPWSVVVALGQVLLARAWLRGATAPADPLPVQLSAILSDEGDPTTDPRAHTAPWNNWLTASDNKWHERFRDELRADVSLGVEGRDGGTGLTDVSELAGGLRRFIATGQFDPVPTEDAGLPEDLRKLRELSLFWADKVAHLDRTETGQVTDRVARLEVLRRDHGLAAHLDRLDKVITAAAALLKTAYPERVDAWKQAYHKIGERLADGAAERVEALMIEVEDPGPPPGLAQRLGWLARAPVKDLEEILGVAQDGERALEGLLEHARDCVHDAKGTGSLEVLRAAARDLRDAVDAPAPQAEAAE